MVTFTSYPTNDHLYTEQHFTCSLTALLSLTITVMDKSSQDMSCADHSDKYSVQDMDNCSDNVLIRPKDVCMCVCVCVSVCVDVPGVPIVCPTSVPFPPGLQGILRWAHKSCLCQGVTLQLSGRIMGYPAK